MKKVATTAAGLALLAPLPAWAALPGDSLAMEFAKMGAVLAIVVGGIYTLKAVLLRLRGKSASRVSEDRHIRIVEAKYMGQKKSLIVVEVGSEYLLLADTPDGLTFMKEVYLNLNDEEGGGDTVAPLGALAVKLKDVLRQKPSQAVGACPVCKKMELVEAPGDKYLCQSCALEFEKVAQNG